MKKLPQEIWLTIATAIDSYQAGHFLPETRLRKQGEEQPGKSYLQKEMVL